MHEVRLCADRNNSCLLQLSAFIKFIVYDFNKRKLSSIFSNELQLILITQAGMRSSSLIARHLWSVETTINIQLFLTSQSTASQAHSANEARTGKEPPHCGSFSYVLSRLDDCHQYPKLSQIHECHGTRSHPQPHFGTSCPRFRSTYRGTPLIFSVASFCINALSDSSYIGGHKGAGCGCTSYGLSSCVSSGCQAHYLNP